MKEHATHSDSQKREGGFAIVLTLLVLTMMTVLVIGFNAATRTEQMAARNFSYQEQASQMAMLGVNGAVALLNSNLGTAGLAVTQPGRLFLPSGSEVALSSESTPAASGGSTNVNAWAGDNYFIARTTDPSAFSAPLVPVVRGTNPLGSYAFWVDDDGSRLNLNAASPAGRASFLPTNARPLVLSRELFSAIPVNNWNDLTNNLRLLLDPPNTTIETNGWGYFLTPRQVSQLNGVGAANYNTMMFQIGAGPPNWRPTNSYALGINGVPWSLETTGSFLEVYGSGNYASSLDDLNSALDAVAALMFRGAAYQTYFGESDGFAAKYGDACLRQLIANINDAVLPGTVAEFTGATAPDMLLGPDTTGTNLPVPASVLGLRPSLFLNEIALGVAYSTNAPSTTAEVQVWFQSEIVDPYRTGQGVDYEIRYKIGSLEFEGTFETNGAKVSFTSTANSQNWNYDGGTSSVTGIGALGSVGEFKLPSQAFVFEWQLGGTAGSTPAVPPTASNITVTRVTVKPALAVLRAQQGNASTVRDWAILADFPADGFVFTTVPQSSQAFGYNGATATAAPPNAFFTSSIEKNDPRVRRYGTFAMPGSAAWYQPTAPTLGADNSSVDFSGGTGVPGIGNDRAIGITNIYEHPSFGTNATGFVIGRPNWLSAFDLSRIHTGLQWRTLQFRAQDAAESAQGHVPDWALLEAFNVTNATASPARSLKVNINALPYPAARNMTPTAIAAAGLSRGAAAGSLLSGMTTTNAPSAAIGTNNLGFPASAGFSNTAAATLVGSNIANMNFTNTWTARRADNSGSYQTNLYTLPAEVLEVNGVSNFSTEEAANEARAQGVYSGVAVSSQVFTVYAVGFATDRQGNVVAESRVRAQVARKTNSPSFGIVFLEPLIWP